MKLFLIIAVLLLQLINIATGQNVLFDISGYGKNQEKAYLGLDNKLKIIVEGKLCSELVLKTDNGKIYQESFENCENIFNPRKFGKAKIQIYTINNNDTLIFKTIKIDVIPLPLVLSIGDEFIECKSKCQISISKSKLLSSHFLMHSLNMDIGAEVQVSGFEISITRNSKEIYKEEINNYYKEIEQLKSDLMELKPGDIVKLDQIIYKYFDGLDFVSDSVELFIK